LNGSDIGYASDALAKTYLNKMMVPRWEDEEFWVLKAWEM
jgi:hypothetical protein